jgi:hypothetical protein
MSDYKGKKLDNTTQFRGGPESINQKKVYDFWQWSFSDLMQNITRGVLGEYIVAVLLGIDDEVRNPWFSFDLMLPDGRTIEVKTMSQLQAWKQKKLYPPRVRLVPTRKWDPKTGDMQQESTFNADIYVICYFKSTDYKTANPLDLTQWEFFAFTKNQVIKLLNGRQTISLNALEQKMKAVTAHDLKNSINSLIK